MTKKELAFVDSLKRQAALSWPKFEKPSAIVPQGFEKTPAWFGTAYIGSMASYQPTLGWTSRSGHNRSGTRMGSQGPGNGYATKLDCLKAMRWDMAAQCAKNLADIDEMIEQEMGA